MHRPANPGASHPTPRRHSSIGDAGRTTRLPTELLSEQAHRLVVFSTVALVLWSFALMLDSFVMPWLSERLDPQLASDLAVSCAESPVPR